MKEDKLKSKFISDQAYFCISDLKPKTQELVKKLIEGYIYDLTYVENERVYDSPIEELLYIALNDVFRNFRDGEFGISYQVDIKTMKNKYRVDFLIHYTDEATGKVFNMVIECDGHDFHEKTKEQAQKDKSRDRDLVWNGYTVLRFTGSEIYEDANKCAYEIYRAFNKMIEW